MLGMGRRRVHRVLALFAALLSAAPLVFAQVATTGIRLTVDLKVQPKLGRRLATFDVLVSPPALAPATLRGFVLTGNQKWSNLPFNYRIETPLCDWFPNGLVLVFDNIGVTWKLPGLQRKPEAAESSTKQQEKLAALQPVPAPASQDVFNTGHWPE